MTQGAKCKRYRKTTPLHSPLRDGEQLLREHIRNSRTGKTASSTGTRGIHQSLNYTVKIGLDLNPIHVVKPRVLTECKPHRQCSDRACYRKSEREAEGRMGPRDGGRKNRTEDAWDDHKERPEESIDIVLLHGEQRGGQEI